jgi:hypothetical protein
MEKKWYGLIEGLLFFVMVLVLLFAPLFSYVAAGESVAVFTPLYKVMALSPSKGISIASFIFLPLYLAWGVTKILVSFRLKDEKEEKASFWLYFIWAGLGLGYLIFMSQDQSYVAFIVNIFFTGLSLAAFYLDYHLYGQK